MAHESFLRSLYDGFNTREIDGVVAAMTPDVDWPNRWEEGGRIVGRENVRDYWIGVWAAMDPFVDPTAIAEQPDGSVAVTVHQVIRNLAGRVVSDQEVRHVFRFDGELVRRMDIEGVTAG